MVEALRLEFYDLALAVLRRRLQVVGSSWYPRGLRERFPRTVSLRAICAILHCIAEPATESIYEDDGTKIKIRVMCTLLDEGQFLQVVKRLFYVGVRLIRWTTSPNSECIHFDVLGTIYWSCGIITFFKHCRFSKQATYFMAEMLARTIQYWDYLVVEDCGWDGFMTVQEYFRRAPNYAKDTFRTFDMCLTYCLLGIYEEFTEW